MFISQAVFRRKAGPRREKAPTWHRASTRKAILEAARELFAANGVDDTSLTQVAERAGFAPPTVYAYFVRKADLIAAIAADDLSTFARTIAEGFPFSEPKEEAEEPEEAIDEEVVELHTDEEMNTAQAALGATDTEELDTGADSELVVAAEGPAASNTDEGHALEERSAEVPSTRKTEEFIRVGEIAPISSDAADQCDLSDVEAPKPRMDDGAIAALEARLTQLEARRADPWLERRLREFERMLGSLEERVAATTEADAAGTVEGQIRELNGRLESCEKKFAEAIEERASGLAKDIGSCEARLRESWNELRTLALEATGRLESLERERDFRAIAAELPVASAETAVVERAKVEPPIWEKPTEPVGADESYLAAARRAAMTAQSLARADEKATSVGIGKLRSRLLFGGCVGLGLVLTIAGVALSNRVSSREVRAASVVHAAVPFAHPAFAANVPKSVALPVSTESAREQLVKGLSYLDGDGVARDDALAARYLESSALAGQPVAQYWLATLFEHGRGEPADAAEAIRWYEAAALQGNLKAMYKLAVSYAEGWGTRQNYSEAARWFSRAAEFGFVNAQYNLGVLYERGLGVPQSLLDAYKWYALAASQGDKVSAARVDALASQLNAEDLATARQAVSAFKPQALDADANAVPAALSQTAVSTHHAKR